MVDGLWFDGGSRWYAQCLPDDDDEEYQGETEYGGEGDKMDKDKMDKDMGKKVAKKWGQCGGKKWKGPKLCPPGFHCEKQEGNKYVHDCCGDDFC